MKNNLKYTLRYLLLLLVAVAAFWQVAFMVYPVKYDMPDCYYPWRFLVGEILQSGELPLWNPYQLFGSPIHADPSSGAWYPLVWIIGFFKGYTLHTLALEFIFHVWFAGIGFFKLVKRFSLNNNTAFIIATAYMLSGMFVGNAQHITYIISACWIPFILLYFIKLQQTLQIRYAAKGALAMFMLVTGGYPAFTITLCYFLAFLFGGFFVTELIRKNYRKAALRLGINLMFGIFTLLAFSVMVVSVYGALPYITRANSFQLENALYGPFSVPSFLSFILPFTSVDNDFIQTDMSMSNAYFSLLLIPILILSFFRKKTPLQKAFLAFGIFALLASLGDVLPLRAFLFNYFPGMNLFRFPSIFRIYVIISFLVLAGPTLQDLLEGKYPLIRLGAKIYLLTVLSIAGIGLYAYISNPFDFADFYNRSLFVRLENPDFLNNLVIQAFPAVLLLTGGLILWRVNISPVKRSLFFGVLLFADLVLAAQLNSPYTVFYKEFTGKESKAAETVFVNGFPIPSLEPIGNTAPKLVNGPFWKNLNTFKKQPSADGMNNFIFSATMKLIDEYPEELRLINKNPLIYLSNDIRSYRTFEQDKKNTSYSSKTLYFKEEDLKNIPINDSDFDSTSRVDISGFSSSSVKVFVQSKNSTVLTLLQSHYIGWSVSVNGKESIPLMSNSLFMSVPIEKGKHTVEFKYVNKAVKTAFGISVFMLVILLGIGFYPRKLSLF